VRRSIRSRTASTPTDSIVSIAASRPRYTATGVVVSSNMPASSV
jgi:hypothetical protein